MKQNLFPNEKIDAEEFMRLTCQYKPHVLKKIDPESRKRCTKRRAEERKLAKEIEAAELVSHDTGITRGT